jgi:hypothetical protein
MIGGRRRSEDVQNRLVGAENTEEEACLFGECKKSLDFKLIHGAGLGRRASQGSMLKWEGGLQVTMGNTKDSECLLVPRCIHT